MIKVEKLDGYIVVSNAVNSIIISKNDRWITVKRNHEDKEEKGRHLLLEDGETPAEAMKRQWGVDLKGKDKPKDNPEQKEQPKTEEKPKEEEKEDLSKYTDDELQDLADKASFENQKLNRQKITDIDENKELRKLNDEYDKAQEEYYKMGTYDSPKYFELSKRFDKAKDALRKRRNELEDEWEKEHQEERKKIQEKYDKYINEQEKRKREKAELELKQKAEAEQKRTKELSDAYTNFKPATTIEEAEKTMSIIAKHINSGKLQGVRVENINNINKTALEMISKYDIKDGLTTFGVGNMRGATLMHASEGLVEFSPKIAKASKEEIEKIFEKVSQNRYDALKSSINVTKTAIENYKKAVEELEAKKASGERISEWDLTWKKSLIKKSEKELKEYEKSAKFTRWTTQTSAENFVRDTTYHEFGHVVMGRAQLFGNFDGVNKVVSNAFMKARKNGDIYKISEYANTNKNEFFAEVFAMRQTNQDLPDYINDMLDTVTGKKSA